MSGTRTSFITALLVSLVAPWILGPNSVAADEERRSNVVLMHADNVGWGDIGTYGGGEMRGMPTPRIDSIATSGLQFTQFLVEPGCTPSRAALMTVRYSCRSGRRLPPARRATGC